MGSAKKKWWLWGEGLDSDPPSQLWFVQLIVRALHGTVDPHIPPCLGRHSSWKSWFFLCRAEELSSV